MTQIKKRGFLGDFQRFEIEMKKRLDAGGKMVENE